MVNRDKTFLSHIEPLDSIDFPTFIKKHFHGIKNVDLTILKMHLIIEYALTVSIDKLSKEDVTKDNRLTFFQKVKVCKALGLFVGDHSLMDQINDVNQIRNELAHTLDFDKKILSKFYGYDRSKFKNEKAEVNQLKMTTYWVFGRIVGILNFMIDINNEIVKTPLRDVLSEVSKRNEEKIKAELAKKKRKRT